MIIVFGSTKGGVGKSTLSLALANYLTQEHRKKLRVLDLDFKQSLVDIAEKTKILEISPLYPIHTKDTNPSELLKTSGAESTENIIVDLPCYLDAKVHYSFLRSADLICCPFAYDEFTVKATLLFALLVVKINPLAPIVFIPNRIKKNIYIESKQEIEKVLSGFGRISPTLYDKIDFQRISNVHTPATLLSTLLPALDDLYETIMRKKN